MPAGRPHCNAARRRCRLAIVWLAAAAAHVGCDTQAQYAPCELDKEVTDKVVGKNICNGTSKAGDTSCVVTQHPHCDQSICLSYYSQTAFCTKMCVNNTECGPNTCCWTFKDEPTTQKYCVPSDKLGTRTCQ
ncbi:MAG: hypothetical protein EXR79_00025 [Myxococcales bacterium]|nr:hypothetical protein [Myxococcales bacterium]